MEGVDLSDLVDGDIEVVATAIDRNGNEINDDDQAELDAVESNITVNFENLDNDAATTDLVGTTQDVAPGSTVTLVITDSVGTTVETSAIVNADGSYSVEGVDLSDLVDGDIEVVATAVDNNGNTITASDQGLLVVSDPPQIIGLDGEGANVTLNEMHLEGGTSPDPSALTQGGEFTLVADAGIQKLVIGSTELTLAQLEALDTDPVEFVSDSGNILKLTGFDSSTGVVSYEYTLVNNLTHEPGGDRNSLGKEFDIVLFDQLGRDVSATLDVEIIDDVPEFGEGGVEDATVSAAETSQFTGDLNLTIGADSEGALVESVTLLESGGFIQVQYTDNGSTTTTFLTSGGSRLQYEFDQAKQKLVAFTEGEDSSPVFTIDFSIGNGNYELKVIQTLDPVAVSFENAKVTSKGGGTAFDLQLAGANLSAQFTMLDGGVVNWSDNGIGGGNNLIGKGDVLVAHFDKVLTEFSFTASRGNGNPQTAKWEIYRDGAKVWEGEGNNIDFAAGFDEVRFIGSDKNNEQYRVNDFNGTYQDANLDYQLPVDMVVLDGDGDPADGDFTITFQPVDASIELPPVTDPDEPVILGLGVEGGDVVVDEAWLEGGTNEGGDSLVQHGTFTLEAQGGIRSLTVAGEEITWEHLQSLADDGPVVIELHSGNKVSITGFSGDLYGGVVSYSYELTGNTLDHDDQGRDEFGKEVSVVLEDRFDNTTEAEISVVIIDDVPREFAGGDVIQLPISEIVVGNWDAGWANFKNVGGSTSGLTETNLDGDSFPDKISWGQPAGGGSGSNYVFEDMESLRDLSTGEVDSTFILGVFTHNNFPITGPVQNDLKSVDLVVKFTIVIDGVETQVTHTINIEHEETPNDTGTPEGDADIVTISNATTLVPIMVGDREFTFEILGFKRIGEPDGEPVSEVITFENASNSFELIGRISSTDDLPTLSGQIEDPFWGADGPDEDEPLLWSTPEGDKAVAEGENLSIVGQYGTLIVHADGSYVYEVSRGARDNMDIGEDKQDVFTYYLQDADGDRVPSTLTITLEAVANSTDLNSHVFTVESSSETTTLDPVEVGFGLFALDELEELESELNGDAVPSGYQPLDSGSKGEEVEPEDSEVVATPEEDSEDGTILVDLDSEESIPVVNDEVTGSDAESEQDDAGSEEETSEKGDSLTESELFDESEELLKVEDSEASQDEHKAGFDEASVTQIPVPEQEELNTSTKLID